MQDTERTTNAEKSLPRAEEMAKASSRIIFTMELCRELAWVGMLLVGIRQTRENDSATVLDITMCFA